MRVLEALGEPISYGGEEAYIKGILTHVDSSDIQIDLLTPYYCDNEELREIVRAGGGEVYELGVPFMPGSYRWREKKHIRHFLQNHQYDVIHIHSGSNTMLAVYSKISMDTGVPKRIVHSHCTGNPGLKHWLAVASTRGTLTRCATDFCACSHEAAEWRFSKEDCERTLVLRNGIDCQKFAFDMASRTGIRGHMGISDETILLGCVGRLTEQKNQKFLLNVLQKLDSRYKLMLVGDGDDRSDIEQIIDNLGLGERVFLVGAVDNVHEYMSAMDLFLFPSIYEGFGIVAIEALSNGLQVLSSNRVPEDIALSEGISFHQLDEQLWVEKIQGCEFIRRDSQMGEIRSLGYDINDTAKEVLKLYGV